MFFPFGDFGAEARAHRYRREDHFDRRPQHVRAPVRVRRGLSQDFQGARRIRRRNGDERRGRAAVRRPPAPAFRAGRSSARSTARAVASMLEYGVRQAGRRNKVTARFPELADLAREAAYIARQEGASLVSAAARSPGARGAHRAPQPDRNENPRNDRRGHADDRYRRRARRTGQRPERSRNRRLRFRQARAHHGFGGARQGGTDQRGARSQSERPLPRQGHADHRRVLADKVRAG